MKYQLRKQSEVETEKPNIEKKARNKIKEGTSNPYPKNNILLIGEHEKVEQQVTHRIRILMRTYQIGEKQSVVKRKRLECVSVGEKVMLVL